MEIFSIDWQLALTYLAKLAIAFLLALPVAIDRERNTRIMGLRTYPIIALASCAFLLIGHSFLDGASPDAQARLMQGLMSGIGFIGAGAILKQNDRVLGTATAASIWNMGAVGAAVAHNSLEIAVALVVSNVLVLKLMGEAKDALNGADENDEAS